MGAQKPKMSGRHSDLSPVPNRAPRWVMPFVRILIIAFDGLLAFLSFAAAFSVRDGSPILSKTAWAWSPEFVPYAAVILFVVPVRILMLAYQGTYKFQGAFSYSVEFIKVFKAVLIGTLLVVAFTFLFRGGFAFREFSYSRGVYFLDFGFALALYSAFHIGLRYVQALIRRRGINLIPTLIVGTNAEGIQTLQELQHRRDLGYRVVGIVAVDEEAENFLSTNSEADSPFSEVAIVGTIAELPMLINKLSIQEVIITDSSLPGEMLFETMMETGRKRRVEFRLTPSLFDMLPQKTSVEQIGVLPMVTLFREPLSDTDRFIKRISDILISAAAIIILAPVWVVIAILIKINSRGGVLFKQERVGMDGRKFLCYKFRTMHSNADEALHREAYQKNIEGSTEANAGEIDKPVFGKVRNDPRITKVGKVLRRSSLDELPQLLNILKGDMSAVGPRPPIPYEVEEYKIRHRKRLDMKPGITGLWQVSGRNRLTFEEMVRTDIYYIENWSLWLDLKIILLTLPAILRGEGE